VADPESLTRGGGERQRTSLLSFIANAHYELYAFYTEESDLLNKCGGKEGEGWPSPSPPFYPPLRIVRLSY